MRTFDNSSLYQREKFMIFNNLYTDKLMKTFQEEVKTEVEKGKNKPFYRAYLNIIKRTADLFKQLAIDDALVKCCFFNHLLWSGFFSKNHQISYQEEGRISNFSALGADIMLGKTACLNNSDMLCRLLRATGTESFIIACDVFDDSFNYNNSVNNSCLSSFSPTKESFISKQANSMTSIGSHVLSLFAYQDSYYLADSTNMTFLNITDLLEATYIGNDIVVSLKPRLTLNIEDVDCHYFKDLIKETFIMSNQNYLSASTIYNKINTSTNLITHNISTILNTMCENEKDIDIVCQTLSLSH